MKSGKNMYGTIARGVGVFPNLSFWAYRRKDGVMAGVCLELGIQAYSEEQEDTRAPTIVANRLIEMSIFQIYTLFKMGKLEQLFSNRRDDQELWQEHYRLTERKIITEVRKTLSGQDVAPKDQIDFSHFSNSGRGNLVLLLKEFSGKESQEASDLLQILLNIVRENYRLDWDTAA